MLDALRTLMLAAIGVIELTDDRVRSMADDLVRRGELAADEARELAALWTVRRDARREAADARIEGAVLDALGRLNVAGHDSVAALDARVAALEDRVRRLDERTAASAPAHAG
jgi:polyhydroxyalkanoate synthesis regulator phasin